MVRTSLQCRQSIQQHVAARRLDTNLHKVWFSEETATLPLWNLSSQLTGFLQYRPAGDKKTNNNPRDGKYFTKRTGLWGLESWYLSNTLFVCEGVFDAAAFTSLDYSALATLSNDVSPSTRNYFWRLQRQVVAVYDNDKAGSYLAKLGNTSYCFEEYNDAGDAPTALVKDVADFYEKKFA